jgi:HEPN domain-containing protein
MSGADPSPRGEARRWIALVEEDLAVAEAAMVLSPPRPGAAAYHLQQAAEKTVKAALILEGRAFRRIHDLTALLADADISADLSAADKAFMAEMTAWGAAWRYPGLEEEPPPDQRDLDRAFALVRSLRSRIGM